MRVVRIFAALALIGGLATVPVVLADVVVPAGAQINLAGGSLDVAATDVIVGGSLQLGGGALADVADFSVQSTGQVQLGTGSMALSGSWSNAGNVDAGSSDVAFSDGAFATSSISGATTFHTLSFVSSSGKHYIFAAGQTQTVNTALTIHGAANNPIQFESTAPGTAAFINLLASGSQAISDVGVSDVHATGQHLAPSLTNEGGSGNDDGWFGSVAGGGNGPVTYTPVPTLSQWAALGLGLLLLLSGWRAAFADHRRSHSNPCVTTSGS